MRPDEARALGDLAGETLSTFGTHVRDVHRGIARRVFRSIGPAATPVRLAHDAIAEVVYAAVGLSLRAGGTAGGIAASLGRGQGDPSIEATPRGRIALGVLGGVL